MRERFNESLEEGDGACPACRAAAENEESKIYQSSTSRSRSQLRRCRSTITGKAMDCGTDCQCEEPCNDICLRSRIGARLRSPDPTASTYSFRPSASHHRRQKKCTII